MRYLYNAKLWDRLEAVVEFLIMLGLMIAAVIKFSTDIKEALFYITLGAIIAPISGIDKSIKRYLLLGGFFIGLWAGYFD